MLNHSILVSAYVVGSDNPNVIGGESSHGIELIPSSPYVGSGYNLPSLPIPVLGEWQATGLIGLLSAHHPHVIRRDCRNAREASFTGGRSRAGDYGPQRTVPVLNKGKSSIPVIAVGSDSPDIVIGDGGCLVKVIDAGARIGARKNGP
jgi:hypothetical protein